MLFCAFLLLCCYAWVTWCIGAALTSENREAGLQHEAGEIGLRCSGGCGQNDNRELMAGVREVRDQHRRRRSETHDQKHHETDETLQHDRCAFIRETCASTILLTRAAIPRRTLAHESRTCLRDIPCGVVDAPSSCPTSR